MEDTRLPKCVMFGELVENEWMASFLDDLRTVGINADQATAARSPGREGMA